MRKLIFCVALCFAQCYSANQITIVNETSEPVYVAQYYAKANILGMSSGPSFRFGPILSLEPAQKFQIERSRSESKMRRELIFSFDYEELAPVIQGLKYQEASRIAVELFFEKRYHIAMCDGRLCGYDEISWRTIKPIKDFFKKISNDLLKKLKLKLLKHPYGMTKAVVRVGKHISPSEVNAVTKRAERAKRVIENLVGESIPEKCMPRIALCFSGGGNRMAICSSGLVAGLDDIGLLDGVLYASVLSGSSWFMSHYLLLGMRPNEYQEQLTKTVTRLHMISPAVISDTLWKKLVFNQDVGLIDLFGIFLANSWFRNINNDVDRQKVVLSSLIKRVENGDYFFPLFTAIETTFDYNWFTFTPYEIGSESTGIFIPTWAFGRKFENGKSVDFAPEPSLGYLMGLWGSALSGTIGDILQRTGFGTNLPGAIGPIVREIIYSTKLEKTSFASAKIFNIAKGMKGIYKNKGKMTFIDGGYESFLAIPPVLNEERAIDIIVILDGSRGVHAGDASPLLDAQEYARSHQLTLPEIDYAGLTERFISVFDDKNDPTCPTIIYMLPVKNDKYDASFDPAVVFNTIYPTPKFVYTGSQVDKLAGLVRQSVAESKEIIIQAIKDKIKMKKMMCLHD